LGMPVYKNGKYDSGYKNRNELTQKGGWHQRKPMVSNGQPWRANARSQAKFGVSIYRSDYHFASVIIEIPYPPERKRVSNFRHQRLPKDTLICIPKTKRRLHEDGRDIFVLHKLSGNYHEEIPSDSCNCQKVDSWLRSQLSPSLTPTSNHCNKLAVRLRRRHN
jgi:hypothetical protein